MPALDLANVAKIRHKALYYGHLFHPHLAPKNPEHRSHQPFLLLTPCVFIIPIQLVHTTLLFNSTKTSQTLSASMNVVSQARPRLYRVQHERSFTYYEPSIGFMSKGCYYMDYSHWFNPRKVRKHLEWDDRSLEPSPFISLFDNLGETNSTNHRTCRILKWTLADTGRRALFHRERGDSNVFIARIDMSGFERYCLSIQFLEGSIDIHGWRHPTKKIMLFPMQEIGRKFHIEPRFIQRSEWLALESIPPEMITRSWYPQ